MLNAISTLAMTSFLAITGGTMNVNSNVATDLVTPNGITFQVVDEAAGDEDRAAIREFFKAEKVEAAADILGLSVDELEAAREAGTSKEELLENAGLTAEEFQALMTEAKEASIAEAIDSGLITEEQAANFAERQGNGRGGRGQRGGNPESVADILGLTVEELEAAREDGITMDELLEDAGLTEDEFREAAGAAREAAREARVAEALENGDITEEEAEAILSGEGRGQGGQRGQRGDGGNGGRGGRGANN